jgi:hypothetical protein
LHFCLEAEKDRRFTGIAYTKNKSFKSHLRSLYSKWEVERQHVQEREEKLERVINEERESCKTTVEESLGRERGMEDRLKASQKETSELERINRDLKGRLEILEQVLHEREGAVEKNEEVLRMLQEAHSTLVESNQYLLAHLGMEKSKHERDAVQWQKTYTELRKMVQVEHIPRMSSSTLSHSLTDSHHSTRNPASSQHIE